MSPFRTSILPAIVLSRCGATKLDSWPWTASKRTSVGAILRGKVGGRFLMRTQLLTATLRLSKLLVLVPLSKTSRSILLEIETNSNDDTDVGLHNLSAGAR
jgi:hypothetical protein